MRRAIRATVDGRLLPPNGLRPPMSATSALSWQHRDRRPKPGLEAPMKSLISRLAAWLTFGLGAGMTYAGWHRMMGGEETVIWGVIIMIAGALAAFATFLLA